MVVVELSNNKYISNYCSIKINNNANYHTGKSNINGSVKVLPLKIKKLRLVTMLMLSNLNIISANNNINNNNNNN